MCKVCGRRPCLDGCPGQIEREEESIVCPVCGEEPEKYTYWSIDGECVGCDQCITKKKL